MDDRVNTKLLGNLGSVVTAGVINQDDIIDKLEGDLAPGLLQRFRGVIGRENYYYFFIVEHEPLFLIITLLEQT
jgi:hypothetical protein